MKVQIISGFLGAGKTTFLRNLLQHSTSDTAVLVNEFGELGIDGTLLSENNTMDVIELPSGCICCSLREELTRAVEEILTNLKPKRLIIEPSGIASPSQILIGLKNAPFSNEIELEPVVGVVDCTSFMELSEEDAMGNFFKDQILNSDIVLLNKADLVSKELLQECKERVLSINPLALTIESVYGRVSLPDLKAKGDIQHAHYKPTFVSEVLTFLGVINKQKLEAFLRKLNASKDLQVFRAKGIINTKDGVQSFDYVSGQIEFRNLSTKSDNKFVFIGESVSREVLVKSLREVVDDGTRT